jgi:hypothetical protein
MNFANLSGIVNIWLYVFGEPKHEQMSQNMNKHFSSFCYVQGDWTQNQHENDKN